MWIKEQRNVDQGTEKRGLRNRKTWIKEQKTKTKTKQKTWFKKHGSNNRET